LGGIVPQQIQDSVTAVLMEWAEGDPSARDRLVPLVYDELKRLAGGFLRYERPGHTLQPTALVHEALLRLYDQRKATARSKEQLMALIAQLMRRVLVDHARRRRAQRRNAGSTLITFADELGGAEPGGIDVLDLNLALSKLAEFDPRQAQIVELRVFGGFGVKEVAQIIELSPATIKREWRIAKIWLHRELFGRTSDDRECP
jgi:RNA polymerase sigma factor (TIGR02999 family)